jgi:small GTP-binding protein
MSRDYSFKIVVVGASGVGKTALVNHLITHTFTDESRPTIGVEFKSYTITSDEDNVKLQIWDTAGQERFRSVSKAYFRNSAGAILVFDLTQKSTFEEINVWMNDLNTLCLPNATILLVGNKSDLADERTISDTEAEEWAKRYNLDYLETSAKTGDHVTDAFVRLGQSILRQHKQIHNERGAGETAGDGDSVLTGGDQGKQGAGACAC